MVHPNHLCKYMRSFLEQCPRKWHHSDKDLIDNKEYALHNEFPQILQDKHTQTSLPYLDKILRSG